MMFSQFIRFIGAGGINTIITYIAYLLLLLVTNYSVSYTIAYILGIALSYWLNIKFVFQEKSSKRKIILFPLVYLFQYLMGILVLYIMIDKVSIPEELGPIIVVIVTLPLTFLLSKKVLVQ